MNKEIGTMSTGEKCRIVYFTDGISAAHWERKIAPEFKRIYEAESNPNGMALFSHAGGTPALSITPESVPYCASLFALLRWDECDNALTYGLVGWVAGDERLKEFASVVFSSV
jgi:hypothetical protein